MTETFETYLSKTRALSQKTVRLYLADKAACDTFLRKQFCLEAEQVTSKEIDLFIAYKRQNCSSSASYKRIVGALASYKAFLALASNGTVPATNKSRQKESPYAYKLPFYCTPEQAEALVQKCLLDSSPDGVRLSLMVQILLFTPIRLQELVTLSYQALLVSPEELSLCVGVKQYKVLVSPEYSMLVQSYKDSCQERLFPLSRQAAAALLRRLSVKEQAEEVRLGSLPRHKRFELLREAYNKVRPRL